LSQKKFKSKQEIKKIEVTSDTLSGRGGLAVFCKYLSSVGIFSILVSQFGHLKKSKKGIAFENFFKQVFCFFMDGSSQHLTYFDQLKDDQGYAGTIENSSKEMASSHTMKRIFKLFSWIHGGVFRKILRQLFLWRLKIKAPTLIELTLDTMVMDNNEAKKRHGAQPTYKKVLGFQPLQLIWMGKIIDAVFRGGKKHSNHGNTVINMIQTVVKLIRTNYNSSVTIVIRLDSGFYDEKIFKVCDELGIGFVCTGKMRDDIKAFVLKQPQEDWAEYDNGHQLWSYLEFEFGCDCWDQYYRTLYTRPLYDENGQGLIDFSRPDNVIITNIGLNDTVLKNCTPQEKKELLKAEFIVFSNHQRGKDELPHRGLKDFGFEELPFKRFSANSAFYYCMLISFFLFETFKEDVLAEVIPITSYATTVRRKVIDIAVKIIGTSRYVVLKIPKSIMDRLNFAKLWELALDPPVIVIT
jgi:hypothetical protein